MRVGAEKEIAAVAAKMLHMKRSAFSFEQEVRIVSVDRAAAAIDRRIEVDTLAMFDQVMIGPSVKPAQADSIRRDLRLLGVSAAMVKRLAPLPTAPSGVDCGLAVPCGHSADRDIVERRTNAYPLTHAAYGC